MIKASELRIGIHVLHNGTLAEVKGFINNDDSLGTIIVYIPSEPIPNYSRKPISPKDIEPIILTPEWMAKCGFSWNAEDQVYYIQVGNTVYIEYDVEFNCSVVPETWHGQSLHLWGDNKYLHKLQNIYFDHTGEELIIKK